MTSAETTLRRDGLPRWLSRVVDPRREGCLHGLLQRTGPDLVGPRVQAGDLPPPGATLVGMIASWIRAADCDDEFATIATVAAEFAATIQSARNRNTLILAIEGRLRTFAGDELPSSGGMKALLDIFRSSGHAASKEGIHLVKRLVAADRDEDAAALTQTMIELMPTAPGYFGLTFLTNDAASRRQMQEAHFARLATLPDADGSVASLLGRQLMQIGEFSRAADALNGPASKVDVRRLVVVADVMFWLDRFVEAEAAATTALQNGDEPTWKERAQLYLLLAKCRIVFDDGQGALAFLDLWRNECRHLDLSEATGLRASLCAGHLEDAFRWYWTGPVLPALSRSSSNLVELGPLEEARESGVPLRGECAVVCVMGLGDEVRMARLLPQIAGLFERLTVLCDSRITSVLRRCFPTVRFHGVDRARPVPGIEPLLAERVDVDSLAILQQAAQVADLRQFATIFLKSVSDIPLQGHHLRAREDLAAKWREWLDRLDGSHPVGLFWRSNLPSHAARHKQTTLGRWLDILRGVDVCIVPLQYDLTDEERGIVAGDGRFATLPPELDVKNDIEEMLGLLAALPLVVSLPGTTQHMAGAVGTPVLCPCHPFEANWRRAKGRHHELWAPSVEIISGDPTAGLDGSVRLTVARLKEWLTAGRGRGAVGGHI